MPLFGVPLRARPGSSAASLPLEAGAGHPPGGSRLAPSLPPLTLRSLSCSHSPTNTPRPLIETFDTVKQRTQASRHPIRAGKTAHRNSPRQPRIRRPKRYPFKRGPQQHYEQPGPPRLPGNEDLFVQVGDRIVSRYHRDIGRSNHAQTAPEVGGPSLFVGRGSTTGHPSGGQ